MSLPPSEPDLPEPERTALSLLSYASAVISSAQGTFHRPGVDDDPEGDPGMAAMHLSCLAAELKEYGQGVREAAKRLEGKTDVCRLSRTAGTSMFEASVRLAERMLVAVNQSLVWAMCEATPTGPELKRVPEWDDVREHWPAIRKTLRDFPEFDLDDAEATLRNEAKRHLQSSADLVVIANPIRGIHGPNPNKPLPATQAEIYYECSALIEAFDAIQDVAYSDLPNASFSDGALTAFLGYCPRLQKVYVDAPELAHAVEACPDRHAIISQIAKADQAFIVAEWRRRFVSRFETLPGRAFYRNWLNREQERRVLPRSSDGSTNGAARPLPTNDRQDVGADSEFIFVPSGDGYEVCGFGERGHFSGLGFKYIHRLLQSAGEPVLTVVLLAGVADELTNEANQRSRQELIDEPGIRSLNQRRQEIENELEANPSDVERAELELEKELIQKELLNAVGKGATLDPEAKKRQTRIQNRLTAAYKKLAEATPPCTELATHFEAAIHQQDAVKFVYKVILETVSWAT